MKSLRREGKQERGRKKRQERRKDEEKTSNSAQYPGALIDAGTTCSSSLAKKREESRDAEPGWEIDSTKANNGEQREKQTIKTEKWQQQSNEQRKEHHTKSLHTCK